MLLGISETANVRAFKPLSLCSAPLKTYLEGFLELYGMKEGHFLRKNVFWENGVGYLRNMVSAESFQTFAIVFSTPENLLVGISEALGM